jgi:hypothetical protein
VPTSLLPCWLHTFHGIGRLAATAPRIAREVMCAAKVIDLCQWEPRASINLSCANYIVGSLALRNKYRIYYLWKCNQR